jgi:hypothetical protein
LYDCDTTVQNRLSIAAVTAALLTLGAMALAALALSENATGVYAAIDHIWSDWPLHAAMARRFAEADPGAWLSSHPLIAGQRLTYPFGVNLASGLLMRAGVGFVPAMLAPTVLAIGAAFGLLYVFLRTVAVPAPWAAVGLALVAFSGGVGAVDYVSEAWQQSALQWPDRAYTRLTDYGWHTGNILVGLWVPQRAFAPGVTVALLGLLALLARLTVNGGRPSATLERVCGSRAARVRTVGIYAAAGLVGLLPLIHMHSALCVWGYAVVLTLSRPQRVRATLPLALLAGLVSVVVWGVHLRQGMEASRFLSWRPGFEAAGKGFLAWLLMWGRMWGPYLLVALTGAALVLRRPRHFADRPLAVGGIALFLIANLVQFQPVSWDNSKMFVWAYLGLLPAALSALERAWRRPHLRFFVVGALVAMTATGALDVAAYLRSAVVHPPQMWNAGDVAIAGRLRRETSPEAVFATSPSHNHPAMGLAGRSILVGFTPWVANFGVDPEPRVAALRTIFAGGEAALAAARLWRVDYVYLGPAERYEMNPDEAAMAAVFPRFFEEGGVAVFRVPAGSEVPAGEPP